MKFFCKSEKILHGYDQQDWATFALPVEEKRKEASDLSWVSYPWAIFIMMSTSCFLRYFRFQDEITQTLVRPECFFVGVAGFMAMSFFLDFNPKEIAVLMFIGSLIAFL